MIKIRVPATSANLGPGFDCLGIALGIYNSFEVEPADSLNIEGVPAEYNNEDNLLMRGYRAAGGEGNLHVKCETEIPISRGLGSSASLFTAGVLSAQLLNDNVSQQEAFQIVSDLEGHPDNAAPSIFGGLTASMQGTSKWISRPLNINDILRFTVLIPDYEVLTEEARQILPESYPRAVAASNAARAVLLCRALEKGDISLLRETARDQIHEPYRSTLIPSFAAVKQLAEADTGGVVVISGSGSTCLLISDRPLSDRTAWNIMTLPEHWAVQELPVCTGPERWENDTWQAIF